MVNKMLQLEADATGRFVYVPEPDESEVRTSNAILSSISLALQFRENHSISASSADLGPYGYLVEVLPEWFKDVIFAITVFAQLLVDRFMVDGKWVKISRWNIVWNFISLVMVFKAGRDIVKAFKNRSDDSEDTN